MNKRLLQRVEMFCRTRWSAIDAYVAALTARTLRPIVWRGRRLICWCRDFRRWNAKRQETAGYIAEVRRIVAQQRKQPGGFWANASQRRIERTVE